MDSQKNFLLHESQEDLLTDLKQSRDQLQIILEGITDGVTVFDRQGHFIYANLIGAQMCGFNSAEELISTPTAQVMEKYLLLDEEGKPFPHLKLPGRQALRGVRNPPETILQFYSKSEKKTRWAIVNASPVFDSHGEVLYAVSIFRDFTHHKENEMALKNREASFRLIAEAGIILDSSLDYHANLRKLCELLTPQMADWCVIDLVKSFSEDTETIVWHANPIKRERSLDYQKKYRPTWNAAEGVTKVIQSGISERYEYISDEMLVHYSESEEHLADLRRLGLSSVMIVPIIGSSKILGSITFIASDSNRRFSALDLTLAEDIGRRTGIAIDMALLYEREKKARELAENANSSKSTFLANMSHEIRTPLNALIGFNEILRSEKLSSEEKSEYHNIIQRNGELLLLLIDDILDLSKVEAGQINLESIDISLEHLLNEISVFMKAKATFKGLQFFIETEENLPRKLSTDPLRLKQILNNIVGNAIKFTSQGFVKVTLSYNKNKKLLSFTVRDSGIGIPNEVREKLFQPFSQADPSVTRKFGGTGLGLILSKKLAQALGGDLFLLRSEEGLGSTFVIEIAANEIRLEKEVQTRPIQDLSLVGRKILVVDDSFDNQVLIEHMLKKRGAYVELAENGEMGIDKTMEQDFDVILMDVQMPILDGHSATRKLRENNYSRPIIALTAHAMPEDKLRCLEAGCSDYITKPIRSDILMQTLAKHLS